MITRHHIVLALICGFISGSAIAGFDPLLLLVILAGTGVGAILPDIHMKRPKKTCLLTVAWYIVHAGRQICIPVMCGFYRLIPGVRIRPDDKRLTHSVPGILLYFTIFAGIVGIILVLCGNRIPVLPVMAFLEGLLMGMLFHLAEDLCTRKGIAVFYPFTTTGIHGSIRPCDLYDNRIPRFHIQHGSVLVVFLFLMWAAPALADDLLLLGLLGVVACIGSMVCQSEIRIEYDRERESVSSDPIAT
jgi:membrane-bound metal-dependent hydrolase YbcI (DUF457 family)